MAIIKRETDYALRAVAHLARAGGWLPVSTLAEEVQVPEDFLRKIMQRLNRGEIVQSRQGPFGGYRLAVSPKQLSVLDVVEAVQGPLVMNECLAAPDICARAEFCPLRKRLVGLQVELNARLDEMNLADTFKDMPSGERVAK